MARAKEREVLEREFEWLLEKEYRLRVDTISTQLKQCSKKFSDAFSSSGDLRPILINQGDTVLCTAAIEGDKILKAEVNLKLPGRGNRPIRTTIKEHYPWKLKQIQDALNYLKDASEQLEAVEHAGGSLEPRKAASQKPAEIRKCFEELVTCLRRAESVLVLPQPTTALEIYNAEQKAALRPALPEDVMLHFHINSAMLVLTILTTVSIPKNQPTSGSGSTSPDFMSTCWLGSTFEQGANVYEVSSQLQVKSLIPWLNAVLQLLQEMLELAQDFTDKVKVFEVMGLEYAS